MGLSIAIARPDDVLATGTHAGREWVVTNNGSGHRCGYVKVEPGHPWHGKDYNDLACEVHGGLTFADSDVHCGKGGADNGWWVGFDCAHAGDAPDPALPGVSACEWKLASIWGNEYAVRTQEYVEAECRNLCEQAAAATVGGRP